MATISGFPQLYEIWSVRRPQSHTQRRRRASAIASEFSRLRRTERELVVGLAMILRNYLNPSLIRLGWVALRRGRREQKPLALLIRELPQVFVERGSELAPALWDLFALVGPEIQRLQIADGRSRESAPVEDFVGICTSSLGRTAAFALCLRRGSLPSRRFVRYLGSAGDLLCLRSLFKLRGLSSGRRNCFKQSLGLEVSSRTSGCQSRAPYFVSSRPRSFTSAACLGFKDQSP